MYDYLVVGAGLFGAVFACEARKAGNEETIAAAREALRIAEEVHNRKLATIKAEQDAAKAEKTTSANNSTSNNSASSTVTTPTPTKEITLKLGGTSATIKADAANEAALNKILDQLESASSLTTA